MGKDEKQIYLEAMRERYRPGPDALTRTGFLTSSGGCAVISALRCAG